MTDEEFDLQGPFDDDTVEIDLDAMDTISQDAYGEAAPRRTFDRRLLLVGFVVLAVLCLVGAILYRIFTDGGGQEQVKEPVSTATQVAVEPSTTAAEEESAPEPTPSPTLVMDEEPTAEPTDEADEPAVFPTSTPPPTPEPPTPTPVPSGEQLPVSDIGPGPIENLLQNADFETDATSNWSRFATGDATIVFSSEIAGPHVKSGASALRISIDRTTLADRYAGVYQTVEVVPNQPYTLELNGQIRSKPRETAYNYRMQYAVDNSGGSDWQAVSAENWVDLPWDAQDIAAANVEFGTYTTVITPTSRQLTLFVRGWHKWPDLSLVEFTLDDLSLTGVSAVAVEPPTMAEAPEPAELPATDEQLMPVTGNGDVSLFTDGRFWGAALVLAALAAGALYRNRWGY
jgi:hypothetical protein